MTFELYVTKTEYDEVAVIGVVENENVAPPLELTSDETDEVAETTKSDANAAVLPERPETTMVHVMAELTR